MFTLLAFSSNGIRCGCLDRLHRLLITIRKLQRLLNAAEQPLRVGGVQPPTTSVRRRQPEYIRRDSYWDGRNTYILFGVSGDRDHAPSLQVRGMHFRLAARSCHGVLRVDHSANKVSTESDEQA